MTEPLVRELPELRDAHASMRVGPYLAGIWERRSFVWYVSVSELRSRQITSVLGNLWHLLNPALNILVFYLVFGQLLKVDRGVDNFILFLSAGIFIFQFTQKATTDGARAIISNRGLLKAVQFPRALLPVTATVTEALAAISTFVVLYAIAIITGEPPSARWALLPLVVLVQLVFNLGAAMIAARTTTHFHDVIQILPFVFRLLLYASGVIFSVDAYVEKGSTAETLFVLNPIYCFLTVGRWCLTGGALDWHLLISGTVWAAAMCVGGFLWFRAAEERYARD